MHGCPVNDGWLLHVLWQAAESVSMAPAPLELLLSHGRLPPSEPVAEYSCQGRRCVGPLGLLRQSVWAGGWGHGCGLPKLLAWRPGVLRYRMDLPCPVCDRAVDCISYFVFLQLPGSYLIVGQLTWQNLQIVGQLPMIVGLAP